MSATKLDEMVSDVNNTNVEHDYFKDVYSYKNLSPITILTFALVVIIAIIGVIGIIWFERNCINTFRTVINQMVATGAWCLLFVLLVCVFDGGRFLNGPYGEIICDIEAFSKNTLWSVLLFTLDVILVLRYIFIFHVKNFAVINDDVLALVLISSIWLVSIWMSIVKRFTPGRLPLNYYLCAGFNPNENLEDGSYLKDLTKYNTGRIILVFSLLLHLLMMPRIFYYQLVIHKKEQPIQLGIANIENPGDTLDSKVVSTGRMNMVKSFNTNKIMLDLVTHIAILVVVFGFGIVVMIADNMDAKNFNLEKYRWIPLTIQIYGPLLSVIAVLTFLLTMYATVQKGILRNFFGNFKGQN